MATAVSAGVVEAMVRLAYVMRCFRVGEPAGGEYTSIQLAWVSLIVWGAPLGQE